MKKKCVLGFLIFFIIIQCFRFFYMVTETPLDSLYKYAEGSERYFQIKEILFCELIDDKYYIIFYLNKNDNLNCSIIKRELMNYKVLEIGAEVATRKNGYYQQSLIVSNSFYDGKTYLRIVWGAVYDEDINKIYMSGDKLKLISLEEYIFRLSYKLYTDEEKMRDFMSFTYIY